MCVFWNVWMCSWVCCNVWVVLAICVVVFGNMCTCIYCVLYCLYYVFVFVSFVYSLFLFVLFVLVWLLLPGDNSVAVIIITIIIIEYGHILWKQQDLEGVNTLVYLRVVYSTGNILVSSDSTVRLGPGCKTPLCEPQRQSCRPFRITTLSPLGNHHDHLEFPEPSRWLPMPKIDYF